MSILNCIFRFYVQVAEEQTSSFPPGVLWCLITVKKQLELEVIP